MKCPVCGAEHAVCGGPWTGQPIDGVVKVPSLNAGPTSRYRDAKGHVFSMTAGMAAHLGLVPYDAPAEVQPPESEPAPDPTADVVDGKALEGPPENKALTMRSRKA